MKYKKIIIMIAIILLLFLLFLLIYSLALLNKEQELNNSITANIVSEPKTTQDVIERYNGKYVKEENKKIYVIFSKDLFDENGESNENYFNNIIRDLKPFYKNQSFEIIDEEKDININVKYNENEDYAVTINNIENFFKMINGKSYVEVERTHITDDSSIIVTNSYLNKLLMNSMYLSEIKEELGEGKELKDGYTSYQNGTIKIRTVPTKAVRNIIFSEDYEGNITSKINSRMSLTEINNINSKNAFGSIQDGYLGYKEGNFYLFFYNDEISVYSYSYKYNKDFEELLSQYIETKDLDTFVNKLINKWKVYDYYEYDEKEKNAYILYSNRGIEINIKNNDSKGITLYNNYYFTDKTKEYVKNGLITLDSKNDLLDKMEKERRNQK